MIFRFIEDHRHEFPLSRMCHVLEVSRSGYYAQRERQISARKMADQSLLGEIETAYAQSGGAYGSPRIYQALRQGEVVCSVKRVARLMRMHGLRAKGVKPRRAQYGTKRAQPVPNLLQHDFAATGPDTKWLSDMTYIRTRKGWLYLAAVLDLWSRRVIGWSMSTRMTSDLPERALKMALMQRRPEAGLLHHSDQGSQYRSASYQSLLHDYHIRVSMNGAGAWSDNAPMESFFATLKRECIGQTLYSTRAEARTALFAYIEGFYNRVRLHSSLGYRSPVSFELNRSVVSYTLGSVHENG